MKRKGQLVCQHLENIFSPDSLICHLAKNPGAALEKIEYICKDL